MFRYPLSLAAGLALLASTLSTKAADMPAPPPLEQVAPIVFETTGWYLRGDIGYGWYNEGDFSQWESSKAGYIWQTRSADSGFVVDGGVGYKITNWFRVDATIGYRFDSDVEGYVYDPVTYADNVWRGSLNSTLLLANAYFDLGTWSGLTPYVGAGIGGAYVDSSWAPRDGYAGGSSNWNFAWALMAGVSYAITPNLAVDVGYRYVHLGDTNSGTFSCANGGCSQTPIYYKDVASNDVRIGLRYTFASGAPVLPAAAPIVTKY